MKHLRYGFLHDSPDALPDLLYYTWEFLYQARYWARRGVEFP